MGRTILGKKIGMTQIFNKDGRVEPVTVVEAGPCFVIQKKSKDRDGYESIQVGFEDKREKLANKPEKGHYSKSKVAPKRYLKVIKVESSVAYELGQAITVAQWSDGETVDVTGTSLGKGFAGAIKRHNFQRGPMGHGSMYHRRPGGLGATDPARVFKGRKLPGRFGGSRVTIQNLKIVKVDPEKNLLLIRGAVPGVKGGLVIVRDSVKGK